MAKQQNALEPEDQLPGAGNPVAIARRLLASSRSVVGAAALLKEALPRDIMLTLLVIEDDGVEITMKDLPEIVGASPMLAERWVKVLERRGLVEQRQAHLRSTVRGRDATRIFIEGMSAALTGDI